MSSWVPYHYGHCYHNVDKGHVAQRSLCCKGLEGIEGSHTGLLVGGSHQMAEDLRNIDVIGDHLHCIDVVVGWGIVEGTVVTAGTGDAEEFVNIEVGWEHCTDAEVQDVVVGVVEIGGDMVGYYTGVELGVASTGAVE